MRRTFLSTGSPQTEDQRWYVLQNWRQDVVVIIDEAAVQRERAFFSPYGRVFGMVAGDTGFDGDYGAGDSSAITGWSTAYRAYADVDLDGTIDATDASYTTNAQLGWDDLSRDGSTIGYAGYVQDSYIPTINHVRHRAMKTDLGRWVQRDPAGYVDGANLYEYAMSAPITMADEMGLASSVAGGAAVVAGTPWSCLGCMACLGAVAASCSILCANDHWDTPGEGFWSCFFKCVEATPDAAPLLTGACEGVCGACILRKVKRPKRETSPTKEEPPSRNRPRRADPGNCSRAEHAALEAAKRAACNGAKRCQPTDSCEDLLWKQDRLEGCAQARRTINRRCYNGGDPRHQREAERQERYARECTTLAGEKGCFGKPNPLGSLLGSGYGIE